MIKNHSLYGINIVFLTKESVAVPENSKFTSIFSGETARGMNFFDNTGIQAKLLDVPELGLSVIWEGKRLRIEDRLQKEPAESHLPANALKIFEKLFGDTHALAGYGFNFDIYYQLRDVIPIHALFGNIKPYGLEMGESLLDLGWQWTVAGKGGKKLDGYFVKITAPLEIAAHRNSHYSETEIPKEKELSKRFLEDYAETHSVVSSLMLK